MTSMGTEILRPQDCLIQRFKVPPPAFSPRRAYVNYSNCYYYNYQPATRPDQRKRVAVGFAPPVAASVMRRSSSDDSKTSGSAMEKVTILRRGQSLDSCAMVTMKSDVYAGSAFAVSPSPSALPLPSFPKKKQATPAFDDSATRDLRRLLRLE